MKEGKKEWMKDIEKEREKIDINKKSFFWKEIMITAVQQYVDYTGWGEK